MSGDILSGRFRHLFEECLTPARQHQAVDALKDYITELKHGTNEQLCELGVFGDADDDKEAAEGKLHAALEKSYWQLVMFLRFSRPSRISEAVPYLRILAGHAHDRMSPVHSALYEVQTTLYLAAALSSASPPVANQAPATNRLLSLRSSSSHMGPYSANTTPGSSLSGTPPHEASSEHLLKDAEALELFTRAWALYDSLSPCSSPQMTPNIPLATLSEFRSASPCTDLPVSPLSAHLHFPGRTSPHGCHHRKGLGPKTELWARAAYASLLRRLGRELEARDAVDYIRSYVTHHPYSLSSEKYHKLLKDIEDDFSITLLDATLGLETDTALGVGLNGETREIRRMEDASDAEHDRNGADEDPSPVLSPILSISTPSDTESSEEDSSVANSPITPCVPHFSLPHEEPPVAAIPADASTHEIVDRVAAGVDQLALEKSATEVRPPKPFVERVQQSESDSDSDSDFGFSGTYRPVSYGAM